ncbi:MAG: YjgN family protein [Pseudomonadota bacterium]
MEVAPPQAVEQPTLPLVFTGKGGEYFGIWIVNLVLTLLTLGIYSAWAKVRRLQYFYRNTSLAGASFDYHGRPLAILKGRIIALVLLLAYNFAGQFHPVLGLAVFLFLACVLPWLLLRSLRFRLHNSSYRGLRFSFRGGLGESYVVFLLLPLVTFFSLYVLGPVWHQLLKRYQHNNAWYGATRFHFDAPIRAFYRIWLAAAGLFLAGVALAGAAAVLIMPGLARSLPQGPESRMFLAWLVLAFLVLMLLMAVFIAPYVSARLQNLVWNNTTLGPHRFVSRVSARRLWFITVTNLLAIALTLGLYRPFAAVRLLKYRAESVALVAAGDLDGFVAGAGQEVGAAGEETADLFDIDIAL